MAIQVRSTSTGAGTTATSRTVPKPSGVVAGDLLLLQIGTATTQTVTLPDGWFLILRSVGTNGIHLYGKIATAGEPSDYTITFGASTVSVCGIVALYSDSGARLGVDAMTFTTGASSTNRIFPTLTTSRDDALLCCFGAVSVTSDNTPDAAMTERWDLDTTRRIYLMTETLGAAGSTGTRTATGAAATSKNFSVAIAEIDAIPDGTSTAYFYGDPDFFVLWNSEHLARTADILATPPTWALIDTGVTGTIFDATYEIVGENTVGLWLMTADGIWWCADGKATTPTWVERLAIGTVQAACAVPFVGAVTFQSMTTLPGAPGSLCVAVGPDDGFDLLSSDYRYPHCYFYVTENYGADWTLVDATNLAHTYTGSLTRNYCFSPRHGMAAYGGKLWAIRMTQRYILGYRANVLSSSDGGMAWSEALNNITGGLNNFTDGALLAPATALTDPSLSASGEVGVSGQPQMHRTTDAWVSSAVITANGVNPFGYGGHTPHWRPTRHYRHADHLLGLFRHNAAGVFHLLESFDGGDGWNFVWNTRADRDTVSGSERTTNAARFPTPAGWPPDAALWVIIRGDSDNIGTDPLLLRPVQITQDYFQTFEDKSGNLGTLLGTWADDGANGFALPKVRQACKPTARYVYNGLDITAYCNTLDLQRVLALRDRTSLGSTAQEARPGLSENSVALGGDWNPLIDAMLGRDALHGTRRSGTAQLDDCSMVVNYAWGEVYVKDWRVNATPTGKLIWQATLRHNGQGARTVTTVL